MITSVAGEELSGDARLSRQGSDTWVFHHSTPGTILAIPAGHVYVEVGSHTGNSEGAVGMRWSYMDVKNQVELRTVATMVQD